MNHEYDGVGGHPMHTFSVMDDDPWSQAGWRLVDRGKQLHRPSPGAPTRSMCGRPINDSSPVLHAVPRSRLGSRCQLCLRAVDNAQKTAAMTIRLTQTAISPQSREENRHVLEAERRERESGRDPSIRAVRGGLPTLGRRRR